MANVISTGAEAIYSSGFTSHYFRMPVKLERDEAVTELYTTMMSHPGIEGGMEFRLKVMKTATRLLFPLNNWLLAQRANQQLSKHALLFAKDLAHVAMGERRPMALETRMGLINWHDAELPDCRDTVGGALKYNKFVPIEFVEALGELSPALQLANLTSTPTLVKDTLTSLYVMFGGLPAKQRK
ncbi:hypothetical protein [Proteus phage 10]|uniref:hypothetical protein n=1 Tax=Proteus columbae TaxID=1987580 RepID=UPI0015F22C56|nr:hypothetical protein [Proteus columbae]QMP24197.1 hypothetical protein [Proteus phage 10]